MNIFIIEDEAHAVAKIERLITTYCPEGVILGRADSIFAAVRWLENNSADLIFMDVQLSDGLCFEIFKMVDVDAKVVITTAFDQYAIAAFKIGSIDYLLKPIDDREFVATLDRARARIKSHDREKEDYSRFLSLLGQTPYKRRFTVRVGERIHIIDINDIAYFYSEDKLSFIVTNDGKRHISDLSLDAVEEVLDPRVYFRITRGFIVNISAIKSVVKYINGRLKLSVTPAPPFNEPLVVSRQRVPSFLKWIET